MQILILESSTSSAKAMLYDAAHGVVGLHAEAYPASCLRGGDGCQDAEAVFLKTAELGRRLAEDGRVDAVVPGGTWHNLLVCDREMTPLTPAFLWSYPGAFQTAGELRRSPGFANEFYHCTGCVVHASYPVFKLLQLRREGMDLGEAQVSSQCSYAFYRLTGSRLTSDCTASGSGLLNVHSRRWDPESLALAGIQEDQLGEVASYRDTRPLSREGARLLGLRPGIPVAPGHPDGALNQVGAGALEPGVMTFSVGTSGALRLSTARPMLSEEPSTWCYLSPGAWLSGAATSGACNCVDWAKGLLFPPQCSYQDLETAEVDEENLPVFLPFLFGERSPGWHDAWQGGFSGVRPEHAAPDFYRSVQEGVLFNLYQCYQLLCRTNGAPKSVQLSGGILHSPFWRQMCCDLFGRELQCADAAQASMLGGAALGLEILGELPHIQAFRADTAEVLYPEPTRHRRLEARFQRYLEEYDRLAGTGTPVFTS